MSFILDALKKSEAERLRKDTPGFADVPVSARDKPASHWMWIIAVLVVVNAGVLAVIYMNPDRTGETVARTPVTGPAPGPVADVAEIAQEKTPERARPEPVAAAPASTDAAPQTSEPAPQPDGQESARISEAYATFHDLKAEGVLQLPDLHLDIHVYSAKPEERFVFVNMGKYKENARLDEGPVVREITPDGVILEHRSTKFLLPRE